MRWDAQRLDADGLFDAATADGGATAAGATADGGAAPSPARSFPAAASSPPEGVLPLRVPGAVTRTFQTPEFAGVTFYEIRAKSVLNRVPEASQVPFRWTVNPYRGCTHACTYCFARNTHTYLDLDAGHDFDSRIVVKTNAAEVLRRELASPRWQREHVAMGTNVDCYQRAEGRYALMPGIIGALRDAGTPFSILTKGTLVLRDLPLLRGAATEAGFSANVSVGFTDRALWRTVESGTPSPQARLRVCAAFTGAGIRCGVLMAPVLPYLTDSEEAIDATVAAIAAAGATHVTGIALHLRPGAREWFLSWLAREHPRLVGPYRRLYGRGAYASAEYRRELSDRVATAARRHGMDRRDAASGRWLEPAAAPREHHTPAQLSLL
ncbi:MAG TPA: Rv2578c family radical SAM protein [Mycobacteriales bacterium]|jgi:DNA repair photolyase